MILTTFYFIPFFYLMQQPPVDQGLLIHEVSRSLSTTHHNRYDSSGRVTSSTQGSPPGNTQHSQQTDIHAPGGFRTHNLNRRADADPRLRPRANWYTTYTTLIRWSLLSDTPSVDRAAFTQLQTFFPSHFSP